MELFDVLHSFKQYSIFGTGFWGEKLYSILHESGVEPHFFVVSDDYSNQDILFGIDVVHISEYMQSEDEAVFIAISNDTYTDIKEIINSKLVNIHYMQEDDYYAVYRYFNGFNAADFLNIPRPVSNKFGFDRGQPIDRYYIERFLETHTSKLNGINTVLEVGDDYYAKKFFLSDVVKKEVLRFDRGDDLTNKATLKSGYYDLFIATQVFHVIYDVRNAIDGAWYLLKEGGTLLATVAGNISQVSWADMNDYGDYWRFTSLAAKKLFEERFGNNVEVLSYGNSAVATAFIQGLSVEDLPDTNILADNDEGFSICIGIVARKE